MSCIRCGCSGKMERHHIKQRIHGGGDEDDNLEDRCHACHKYEHTLRALTASLEYEKQRGQTNRIACYQHRIKVLEELNTPEIIRGRKTYLSYWTDRTTNYLPRRIPTKEEAEEQRQFNSLLDEAMERGKDYKPAMK